MQSKIKIQVLGSGCTKCKALENKVKELVVAQGVDADIEKVTDIQQIMKFGVMSTPGLVINGVVKSYGTIPQDDRIVEWLKESAQ